MKKLISMTLCIAMVLSLMIVPVGVSATETESETVDTGKFIASGWFGSTETGEYSVAPDVWTGYNLMSLTEPVVVDADTVNNGYVQVLVSTMSGVPTELRLKLVMSGNIDDPGDAVTKVCVDLLKYDPTLATDIGTVKLINIPFKDFQVQGSTTMLTTLMTHSEYGGAEGADGKMKITATRFKGNSSSTAIISFKALRFWNSKPVITVSNQKSDSMTISWDTMLYTPGYKVYKDGVAVGEQTAGNTMKITGLTPGVKNSYTIKAVGETGTESAFLEEEITPMNLLFWKRNMESWANLSVDPTLTNAAFSTQTWANRDGVNTWWANLYSNGNVKLINSNGFGLSNATVNDTVLTFYTKYLDNGTGDFSIAFGYPNAAANAYTWKTVALDASNLNSSETNPFYDVSEKTNPITGDVHAAGGFTYVSIPLSNMQTTSLDGFTDPNGFDWSKVDRMMFICLSASGGSKASLAFDEVKLTSINPYVKEVKLYDAENEELTAENGVMSAETKKIALSFSRALDESTINGIDVTYNGVSYVVSKAYDFFGERVVITLKDALPYGQKLTIDVPNTVQSAPSLGVPVASTATGASWGLLSMDATAGNSGNNPVQAYSQELTVEDVSEDEALANARITDGEGATQTTYTDTISVKGSVDVVYSGVRAAKGIFAIYNADGTLKTVKILDITTTTAAGTQSTEAVTLSNGEKASFFVWDGFANLKPVLDAAHIDPAE